VWLVVGLDPFKETSEMDDPPLRDGQGSALSREEFARIARAMTRHDAPEVDDFVATAADAALSAEGWVSAFESWHAFRPF
jgi:hypothetical protein